MSDALENQNYEITELGDEDLDDVAGGGLNNSGCNESGCNNSSCGGKVLERT